MEIFKVRETSERATHRVLEHWHDKSTLEGVWEGWGERESPCGFRVPSNRGLLSVTLGLGSQQEAVRLGGWSRSGPAAFMVM